MFSGRKSAEKRREDIRLADQAVGEDIHDPPTAPPPPPPPLLCSPPPLTGGEEVFVKPLLSMMKSKR